MKFLRCKICSGELDVVGNELSISKKVKCNCCGYTNESPSRHRAFPEISYIR